MMVDYSIFTNDEEQLPGQGIVLKKARAKVQSPGGVLSTTVRPEGTVLPNSIERYRQRAGELYNEGASMYDAEPDMSQLQAFAKQRSQQGEAATLNALAAQFAGEQFQPLQAQFLKKAAAAQEPIKVGSGMITADGQFLKDPEAGQAKKAEFLMRQAQMYENLAQNAETARERIAAQREAQRANEAAKLLMAGIAQQGNDIRAMTAQAQIMQQQNAAADRKERQLGEGTQKLSKQSEDLTNLVAGTRRLNDQLGVYSEKGAKGIPGIGYGTDVNILGMDVSGPFIGEEGKANRSMVKNVANELLRLASGQAVTLNEAQRQQLANMASGSYSERDFLNAWENVILPKVNEAVANVGGGYSQEVKDRYRNQGGRIDFNAPFQPPARNKPQAGPGGNLSAQEQAELEALRKRFNKGAP